jgi:hypothetical protein
MSTLLFNVCAGHEGSVTTDEVEELLKSGWTLKDDEQLVKTYCFKT